MRKEELTLDERLNDEMVAAYAHGEVVSRDGLKIASPTTKHLPSMPTCPICLTSIQPGQALVSCALTTYHTVHARCDAQHRSRRPSCAICRDPYPPRRNYVLERQVADGTVAHVVEEVLLANGSRYMGTWSDDSPHGHGRMVMPSGRVFEGEFCRGHFRTGTWVGLDGRRYEGELV